EEAAQELHTIASNLGDKVHEMARVALARARLLERERIQNDISRDDATVERTKLVKLLHRLIKEIGREAPRLAPARPAPVLVSHHVGRHTSEVAEGSRARPMAQRKLSRLVTCKAVEKRFGPGFKLGPVSFRLRSGEILGVVGANGSGKSSLLRIVA